MRDPSHSSSGLILGIESSCDETAAAVVHVGREVLSNIVASQIDMHALYGGVVPELASREHLRNIVPVVREALRTANVRAQNLDAIAVTSGPGLAGALLVGISFAKAYSFALGKPLIAINHLEGHIHAVLMQQDEQSTAPTLALVVSGGHTHLYLARQQGNTWHYRNVGRTVDDAAGEAFDKVAKLLGLPYPGGPWIDRLSQFGNAAAIRFNFTEINRGTASEPTFDFSFSGIKTAALRYVQTHAMQPSIDRRIVALRSISAPTLDQMRELCDAETLDLIASFQHAVVGNLLRQALAAAAHHGATRILVSGGVAANRELRTRFSAAANARGHAAAYPQPALSTDNAAMIAAAAWPHLLAGNFASSGLNAEPRLKLG